MADKIPLRAHPALRTRGTIAHQAHRCAHIIDGAMGVFSLQSQLRDKRFQLVRCETGIQQAHHLERVESLFLGNGKTPSHIPPQIMVENMTVETHIVPQNHAVSHILQELFKSLPGRKQRSVIEFFVIKGIHWVDLIAQHGWHGLAGLDVKVKRLTHNLSPFHAHGRYFYDVIVVHIRSRSLGIEHHHLTILISRKELLQIGGAVIAQQISRRYGQLDEFSLKATGKRTGVKSLYAPHHTRPADEIVLICQHRKMSKEQPNIGRLEEITPRNLEVANAISGQRQRYFVGIGVGTHYHGSRFSLSCQLPHLLRHQPHLIIDGRTVDDLQISRLCLSVISRHGKQLAVYGKLLLGIIVEHFQQIAGGTVVLPQMMDVALAAQLHLRETLHLGSHKGEYGLLLIAQIHHRGMVCRRKQVDNGQLHGVKVLHFVHLYPPIPPQPHLLVGHIGIIGQQKQVLKVYHVVGLLVLGITPGVTHLVQQCPHLARHIVWSSVGIVQIVLRMRIDGEQRIHAVFPFLHLADVAQRLTVGLRQRFGVQIEPPRMPVLHLLHEMREENNLLVVLVRTIIAQHALLIVILILSQDAHALLVVDDGRVGRNYLLLKQEARAKAMNIAHLQPADVLSCHHLAYAVGHSPRRAVGEGQTKHIAKVHPVGVRPPYAFRQYVCLAASRRCQHQVMPLARQDNGSLARVKSFQKLLFVHTHACKDNYFPLRPQVI